MARTLIPCLLLLGACDAAGAPARDASFQATARALDGDTVAADFRLLGVDAFERRQLCEKAGACWRCGKAAQDLAARVLHGGYAEIRLTPGKSYGRPVAVVTVNGEDLGETMIRAGLAIPQPQYLKTDPVRAARYGAAHAEALRARAGGLAGSWLPPADWRHGQRLACER